MKAKPAQVRIIGGQWRRRLLPVLDAEGCRPTPDRVRETLFNWLAPEIQGTRCLDLFAGTGVLAFEALSRSAKEVILIENQFKIAAQLKQNAILLSATNATVLQINALEYLKTPPAQAFDIIFCDPPYALKLWESCLRALENPEWLAKEGVVYLELPRSEPLPELGNWEIYKQSTAGSIQFYLLKKQMDPP